MPRKPALVGRSRAIVWPRPGVTQLSDINVRAPRGDQVTVEISVSVVSPGTERARFLGFENAQVRFPHRPGYLAAGHVTHDPHAQLIGTAVAVRGAPHQRMVTVPAGDVHVVPANVDLSSAAAWQLGVIALHGLDAGGHADLRSVAVVGSGILGVLARRLASARGATRVVAVAASEAKRWTLEAEANSEFLVATQGKPLDELDVDVVVDATGTADGLLVATAIAPAGASVVILGSPRCATAPLPVADMRRKGLRVIGAHGDGLRVARERTGTDPEPAITAEFFAHLVAKRLVLDDLLKERVLPAAAPRLYRRLASDRSLVGATFDWDAPPANHLPSPTVVTVPSTDHPPLRFGLLGCGDVGVQNASAVALATGAELVACFDPVDRLADDVSATHGAETTSSFEALLGRDDVDIVFVATPHDLHEPLVLAAIAAGKHVLVEKPLAADLASAVRIADAANAADTHVGICLPMRDDPRVVSARDAIAGGYIGTPHGALGTYLADKPPSYYFGGFSSRAPSTWRLSKERSGGGVLIMNLVHHLDMIRCVTGREALEVRAATLALDADNGIEDLASVVVDFDGLLATFVAGSHVVRGPGDSLQVWGDAGHVEILPMLAVRSLDGSEDPHGDQAALRSGRARADSAARRSSRVERLVRRVLRARRPTAAPKPDEDRERRVHFIERFTAQIAHGQSPGPSVADGLAIQTIVTAAYQAAAQGIAVRPADVLREVAR